MTPWTVAGQAPLSMEFSRQEHWSGFPFPSPGNLSDPGIKPRGPTSAQMADYLPSEPPVSKFGPISFPFLADYGNGHKLIDPLDFSFISEMKVKE